MHMFLYTCTLPRSNAFFHHYVEETSFLFFELVTNYHNTLYNKQIIRETKSSIIWSNI